MLPWRFERTIGREIHSRNAARIDDSEARRHEPGAERRACIARHCGTRSAGRAKEAHVATKTSRAHIPNGKISEAFLDFASPLIEAAGPEAGRPEIEPILKIAFAVWNAVVIETVRGDSRFVDEIRQAMAAAPGASAISGRLVPRPASIRKASASRSAS